MSATTSENRRRLRWIAAAVLVVLAAWAGWRLAGRAAQPAPEPSAPQEVAEAVENLAARLLIVDTHIDLPYRLHDQGEHPDDVSQRTEGGTFDAVRAREGGLDVAWMSIYVPSSYQEGDGAKSHADGLIDGIVALTVDHPDLFGLATGPEEAEAVAASGRIALAMGMENGAGIEGDLQNLRHFHGRGVRYVTLTHATDNLIADSSYSLAGERRWNGLSPFGAEVIAEMNRLAILVDLSHVSDDAFDQAIELTRAPPIASHSSCRHFTPGFERNLDDERIRTLAGRGGVIQINFGSGFLTAVANAWSMQAWKEETAFVERTGAKEDTAELDEFRATYRVEHPLPRAALADVVDHIDHVVELVGVDHVGLGSDFDGVGDSLPTGLEDVSKYPELVAALRDRGYTPEEIEKIVGGNLMRVWREAERIAAELNAGREEADPRPVPPARLD
jgi:membrane dipeptidase